MHIFKPIKLSFKAPTWHPPNFFCHFHHLFSKRFPLLFAVCCLLTVDRRPIHSYIPLINYAPNELCFTSPASWISMLILLSCQQKLTIFVIFKIINNNLRLPLGILLTKPIHSFHIGGVL